MKTWAVLSSRVLSKYMILLEKEHDFVRQHWRGSCRTPRAFVPLQGRLGSGKQPRNSGGCPGLPSGVSARQGWPQGVRTPPWGPLGSQAPASSLNSAGSNSLCRQCSLGQGQKPGSFTFLSHLLLTRTCDP